MLKKEEDWSTVYILHAEMLKKRLEYCLHSMKNTPRVFLAVSASGALQFTPWRPLDQGKEKTFVCVCVCMYAPAASAGVALK